MKHITDYIREAGEVVIGADVATPLNTMGMGNPCAPDGDCAGSEPMVTKPNTNNQKTKKKRKDNMKTLKEQLTNVDESYSYNDLVNSLMQSIQQNAEINYKKYWENKRMAETLGMAMRDAFLNITNFHWDEINKHNE